jgi:hypothetical protein
MMWCDVRRIVAIDGKHVNKIDRIKGKKGKRGKGKR